MEDPLAFLPNFWNPSQLFYQYRESLARRTTPPPRPPPATMDPAAAALEIQRACRGFLARRSAAAVRGMESEVLGIEREAESSLALALGDERERARLGEMLMEVLLRLDSVRGARDYRRKVIRKAIRLQEALDASSEEVRRGIEEEAEGRVPAGGSAGEGTVEAEELGENGFVMVEEEKEKEALRRMVAELTARNAALTRRVEDLERKVEEMGGTKKRKGDY